jgi:alpha-D-xyloside xylohydrolase
MCGFGFWSHDIGGFEGPADAAVFKRWVAFGLLSSHSRLHGHRSYRVPWLFDEEAVDVLRKFLALKHRLMPYLFAAAVTAHREGIPVMRPMALEFPDDAACAHLERQYMLGSDLLVAPVFCAEGDVTYYVPGGTWIDLLRGVVIDGPRWIHEQHGFAGVPLLVRPGAVIAMGARDDRPDYDYAAGVTLRVYGPRDGAQVAVSVPTTTGDTGAVFAMTHRGRELRLQRTGPPAPWRVLVVGRRARSASGGALASTAEGALVELEASVALATIELDE